MVLFLRIIITFLYIIKIAHTKLSKYRKMKKDFKKKKLKFINKNQEDGT